MMISMFLTAECETKVNLKVQKCSMIILSLRPITKKCLELIYNIFKNHTYYTFLFL